MPSLFVPNGFLSAFELESHDAEDGGGAVLATFEVT
jgi:hypothetical protein